jgi:hypothetical protein
MTAAGTRARAERNRSERTSRIASPHVTVTDDPARRRYVLADTGPEIEPPKGDVTEGVVRVGGTVRRPHQPQSLAVAGYLDHLQGHLTALSQAFVITEDGL